MGYKTHNFLAGAKLSAQSLNEMDEQIKENTDGVALFYYGNDCRTDKEAVTNDRR